MHDVFPFDDILSQEWSDLLLEYTKHRDAKIGRALGEAHLRGKGEGMHGCRWFYYFPEPDDVVEISALSTPVHPRAVR